MHKLIVLAAAALSVHQASAQKMPLTKEAIENWETLSERTISPDGRYIAFGSYNTPVDGHSLTLASSDGRKKLYLKKASEAAFTADSRCLYFRAEGDSIGIVRLPGLRISWMPHAGSVRLYGKWAVSYYDGITVMEQGDTAGIHIKGIQTYRFNGNHQRMLLQHNDGKLSWFEPSSRKQEVIYDGSRPPAGITIDGAGKYCAFVADQKLYLSKNGLPARPVIDSLKLADRELRFDVKGRRLFFVVERPVRIHDEKGVNIWHYKDEYLQSEQRVKPEETGPKRFFTFAYQLETGGLAALDREQEYEPELPQRIGDYALVSQVYRSASMYDKQQLPYLDIVHLADGRRETVIPPGAVRLTAHMISPDDRFVVYFDSEQLAWFTYEIATKQRRNISAGIPYPVHDEDARKILRNGEWGFAAWIAGERAGLIYDQFDIWKVALDGSRPPVNITGGFGRRYHITLALVEDFPLTLNAGESFVVSGYSRETKDGAYWQMKPGKKLPFDTADLRPFSVHSRKPVGIFGYADGQVKKAAQADVFLVQRETAASSRNLFVTKDLKHYTPVSDIHPEKAHHWLTAELVNWTMLDGRPGKGILYKPGNFDPSKKYPLIFNYYEKRSDELHEFLNPAFSRDNINIPLFTDNGYLVFIPDIFSTPMHNGEGSYNAIESAARYVCTLPYVDTARLGLQGHSYGGWQTCYMITHSTRFAAACEAAGVTNQVSAYGQVQYGQGTARNIFYENGSQGSPYGIGVTPWTRPDRYMANSPVFFTDKVTTPFLMMHNRKDAAVPYEQAIEFYTGLQRAGKKVWMLEYDRGEHSVVGKDAEDYHTRMMQFFDHYLKGSPPPVWMTRGVPLYRKGLDDGLATDNSGVQP